MTRDDEGRRRGRIFVILVVLSGLMGVLTALQIFTGIRIQEPLVGRDAGRATPHDETYEGNAKGDAAVGKADAAGRTGRENGSLARPPTGHPDSALTVAIGPVELLYPGLDRVVPVRVTNPFDFDIRITNFEVKSAGTSACPAGYLSLGVRPADGPVIVANGFVDTHTTIGLNVNAPDSCQLENFDFSVTVTAAKS